MSKEKKDELKNGVIDISEQEKNHDTLAAQLKRQKESAPSRLEAMKKLPKFVGQEPKNDSWLVTIAAQKVPLLSKFLHGHEGIASSLIGLEQMQHTTSTVLNTTAYDFQYVGLALKVADFFRIPLIYVTAYIAGEKIPFTLGNNARWVYAVALLGLAVTAIALPAVAPYLAIAGAGLGLAASVGAALNLIYQRYKTQQALKVTELEIVGQNELLEALRARAITLEKNLQGLDQDSVEAKKIFDEVELLDQTFNEEKEYMQTLYDKQLLQQKQLQSMGVVAFMDKGVGIGLSCLGIIGLAMLFVYPPAGLIILAATSGIAATYITARITAPLIKKGITWIAGQFGYKGKSEPSEIDDNKLEINLEQNPHLEHDSTLEISRKLDKEHYLDQLQDLAGTITTRPAFSGDGDPEENQLPGEQEPLIIVAHDDEEDDGESESPKEPNNHQA